MLTISDSICAEVLSKDLYVFGVGNELRIRQRNHVSHFDTKLHGKIHKLNYNSNTNRLLVAGDREFMLLEHVQGALKLLSKAKVSDWIIDAKILNQTNKVVLLTAHNTILFLEYDEALQKVQLLDTKSCTDKSTLYCALLKGETIEDLIVFGGTALGELIIWKPSITDPVNKGRCSVLKRISAHNGVIYSIDINFDHNILTTTSDDRSLRIWKTKFKEKLEWDTCELSVSKTVYGHTARVFVGRVILRNKNLLILTAGEDSQICIWNSTGELLFKKKLHYGATIWDVQYDDWNDKIISTGSDGNVIELSMTSALYKLIPNEIRFTENDQYPSKIKFLDFGIIAITNKNNVIIQHLNGKLETLECISNIKCTELQAHENAVAIGGYQVVALLEHDSNSKFSKVFEGAVVPNVVRSLIFLSRGELVVCDSEGCCRYTSDNFQKSVSIEIPYCKERWLTSALKVDKFLILNDRQGRCHLYGQQNSDWTLKFTLSHVHGFLGITKISLKKDTADYCLLETSGHDYALRTLKLEKEACKMSIIHTERTPVSWIEGFDSIQKKKRIIYGFNDNHFVMWNPIEDFICKITCGGGHRSWDIKLKDETVKYAFIKNKSCYSVDIPLPIEFGSKKKVQHQWHTTQCNVLKCITSDTSAFIFSGGEDGIVKFFKLHTEDTNRLELLSELYLHISSVKCMAVVEKDELSLVFTAGGRAQICVTAFRKIDYSIEEVTNFFLKENDMKRKYQRTSQDIDFDPETRFMDLDLLETEDSMLIFVGCSDGFIRVFKFADNTFSLVDSIFYNSCLLHVKIVKSAYVNLLMAASTNGFVSFFNTHNIQLQSDNLLKIKHHDSGVNSLDFLVADDLLHVLTGGDDQKVVISTINLKEMRLINSRKIEDSHSSQVNGVRISRCGKFLFSLGIDQYLYKYAFETLSVAGSFFSCVSDIKGLNILDLKGKTSCILYGYGLQITQL